MRSINDITELVIGCAYDVGNGLGSGLLEKNYENGMAHLIRKRGLTVEQQVALKVWFDGIVVGEYIADLLVEGRLLIEIKAAKAIDQAHIAQVINYLKITKLQVALLINFGTRVEIKRIVNDYIDSTT